VKYPFYFTQKNERDKRLKYTDLQSEMQQVAHTMCFILCSVKGFIATKRYTP